MWFFEFYLIGMYALMFSSLMLIWREIRKIEKKMEHPDDKPPHQKYWGNGKKKR